MTSTRGQSRQRGGGLIEFIAVLLLGVATLGSAWCGYQASRWNGEQSTDESEASDLRVEASRLFGLATQKVTYDSVIISQYAQAVAAENVELQAFYRDTLIRPEFIPTLEMYRAQIAAGEPVTNLLENQDYLDEQFATYYEAEAKAEASGAASRVAGKNADDFVLLTVLFASALFFAGVTTSFRAKLPRLLLILAAGFTLAYSAARLVDLPVA